MTTTRHRSRLLPTLALSAVAALAGLPASAIATESTSQTAVAAQAQTMAQPSPALSELLKDVEKPKLWLESKAPALQIAEFMRGDPVTAFQKDHVYVVEFWATWCGPCIRAFPHLAELQAKYDKMEDANVTIMGVNIWEDQNLSADARRDLIANFVDKHTEMQYTVALESGTAMAETWMRAAGRNGIPSAFIVDQQGQIAWMGHPMGMDEPLAQIVAGEWDAGALSEEMWNSQLVNEAAGRLQQASVQGDFDTVMPLAETLGRDHLGDNPGGLNYLAWMLVQNENTPPKAAKQGVKLATKAAELTEWKDHSIIDTLAMGEFHAGNRDRAVELIQQAITLVNAEDDGPNKTGALEEYNKRLATFRGEG
jgi:thiol-disulfide isomerase/thioredoxin